MLVYLLRFHTFKIQLPEYFHSGTLFNDVVSLICHLSYLVDFCCRPEMLSVINSTQNSSLTTILRPYANKYK